MICFEQNQFMSEPDLPAASVIMLKMEILFQTKEWVLQQKAIDEKLYHDSAYSNVNF